LETHTYVNFNAIVFQASVIVVWIIKPGVESSNLVFGNTLFLSNSKGFKY